MSEQRMLLRVRCLDCFAVDDRYPALLAVDEDLADATIRAWTGGTGWRCPACGSNDYEIDEVSSPM